jgi:hypothetical protein
MIETLLLTLLLLLWSSILSLLYIATSNRIYSWSIEKVLNFLFLKDAPVLF